MRRFASLGSLLVFPIVLALIVTAFVAGGAGLLAGCGGATYTPADETADRHIGLTARACESLCLSDGGCTAGQAVACLDGIACSAGSSLHRHGARELVDGGMAGCAP